MRNEKVLLLILAVVQFTHIVDFMIIMPLGAQLMGLLDITPRQFSWIVGAYAVSACFSGLISAMFIDRFDRKKALLGAYLGFTIGTLACALANSFEFFLLARSVAGAFGGILGALVLAVVGDVIPFERRSSAMGLVMTAFSVASVVGVPAGIYLAAEYTWHMPFLVIGGVSFLSTLVILFLFPSLTDHMEDETDRPGPIQTLTQIFSNSNQTGALFFSIILMLGHFSIIPFIAPYMQLNVGFSDHQVAYIYTVGGVLTVFLLPFFGRLADRFGNPEVFTIASFFALFSIFAVTNIPHVSILIALCVTSSFFVVASGRNVPATTMVTAVVQPKNRGSFMSVRASFNQMALAIGSFMAGMIVTENPDGSLANYQYVGYIAIVMSILAVVIAWRLRPVDQRWRESGKFDTIRHNLAFRAYPASFLDNFVPNVQNELSMSMHYHFMVDFTLPGTPCDEFFDLIPYQRVVVNKYFQEGKLLNYALSEEKSKLWAVFNANSEMEVLEMLVDFPLTRFMQVEITLLSQFDGNALEPTFSLNQYPPIKKPDYQPWHRASL